MIATLVCLVALQAKSPTLLSQLFPRVTGQNGYEDYVAAVDLISDREVPLYTEWTPTQFEAYSKQSSEPSARQQKLMALVESLHNLNYLEVQKKAIERYGKALDFIKQGNLKSVQSPHNFGNINERFPEFTFFKQLVDLSVSNAYVHMAAGNSARAVKSLTEALTFANRISANGFIGSAYYNVLTGKVLRFYTENIQRFSATDCVFLRQAISGLLGNTTAFSQMFECDQMMRMASLRAATTVTPDQAKSEELVVLSKIAALSPSEKAQFATTATEIISRSTQAWKMVLLRPENEWYAAFPEDPRTPQTVPSDPTGLAEYFVPFVTVSKRALMTRAMITRVQLRIFAIDTLIEEYRWRFKELPTSLADLKLGAAAMDPFSGQPFEFEAKPGGTYRVFSKGLKETGEIDQNYVSPIKGLEPTP